MWRPAALAQTNGDAAGPFGDPFEAALQARRQEADAFYATVIPAALNADAANVMRQALAGMLWSKQFYHYDVDRWLEERGSDPFKPTRKAAPRNDGWHHMYNADVISMPDKWEYPWYAAWDLAFHVLALTLVDEEFGKQQLDLMLREQYLHPNGQIPAYEWNFGDVNPPVHAWSTIFTYRLEKARHGQGDLEWLERIFQKLLLNFTWWVNRKDRAGRNVFEGGFLGLDNIGVFDRSAPLPTGGYLEQADGTAWMALFCQNMLEIAAELAHDRSRLHGHGAQVHRAFPVDRLGDDSCRARTRACGMRRTASSTMCCGLPNGQAQRLKVRSMVGLLPLCAATVFEGGLLQKYPEIGERFQRFLERASGTGGRHPRPAQTGLCRPPARRHLERNPAAPGAGEDARRARVPEPLRHPVAVPLPRRASRMSSRWGARNTGCRTCRRNPTPACSAATPTGADRSGCP